MEKTQNNSGKGTNKPHRGMYSIKPQGIIDFYNFYLGSNNDRYILELSTYREVIKKFNLYFESRILKGDYIRLPFGLGALLIVGRKNVPKIDENGNVRGLCPNYGATYKLWSENPQAKAEGKKIYFENNHSDGYTYKLIWNKQAKSFRNAYLYTLRTGRLTRKKIYEAIVEGAEYTKKIPINVKRKHNSRIKRNQL